MFMFCLFTVLTDWRLEWRLRISAVTCGLWCCILRHVHILFKNEFSKEWALVIPLSVSSILSFPKSHKSMLITSSPPYHLSFNNMLYMAAPMQDVNNPLSLPSFLLFLGYYFRPLLYAVLHFLHDRSDWCFPSSSSTTVQNFSDVMLYIVHINWESSEP